MADDDRTINRILELIPEGSSVSWGGSMSVEEIGLKKAILDGNYKVKNRDTAKTAEEKREAELAAYAADYFLASSNAMWNNKITGKKKATIF